MVGRFHCLHSDILFCTPRFTRSLVVLPKWRWNSSIPFVLMFDANPLELLIELLLACNEEIPHSFLTSKQIGRKIERESLVAAGCLALWCLVAAGWLPSCI
jgi:hypothetical protein